MDKLLNFMFAYHKKYNRLLIIIGMDLYEYEDQQVRIIHADEDNEIIVVENKHEDRYQIERSNLSIRTPSIEI